MKARCLFELVWVFLPHLIVTLESHKLKVQCISYMYCIGLAIVLVVVASAGLTRAQVAQKHQSGPWTIGAH